MTQIHDISQAHGLNYWKNRAHQAEEKCAAQAQEIYFVEETMANPNFTDGDKIFAIIYYQQHFSVPARPDGRRYYSPKHLAARLGVPRLVPNQKSPKEQAISPRHAQFRKAGLIDTLLEPQKNNKGRANHFDLIQPQWLLNPAGVVVNIRDENSPKRGGKRVALHRECGGMCVERTTYTCLKCGRGVDENHILMIDEEKWEHWHANDWPCTGCGEGIPRTAEYCPRCGCQQDQATELEIPAIKIETLAAPALAPVPGKHRRGIPCPECGQEDCWIPVPTSYGETIDICTNCYPEYKRA